MRKLLFSSLILVACGTSEESVNATSATDSTEVVLNDSLSITKDSVRAITHGSPEQEKLDSIKKAKQEQKK
jgi:uncharacterized protein YcfL